MYTRRRRTGSRDGDRRLGLTHLRSIRSGYTAIDVLTTIAALIIWLGAMVSLARHVRASSAEDVTKDLLRHLDEAMSIYISINSLPKIPPFIPENPAGNSTNPLNIDESGLARLAEVNNQSVVRLLKANHVFPTERFDDLSISYYDGLTVRDAWGSPIVFMGHMHPAIGMAANGWFFFSAGPDRKYTTRGDNLYSYELPGLDK